VAPPQAEAGEGTGGTRFIASLIPSATTERGPPKYIMSLAVPHSDWGHVEKVVSGFPPHVIPAKAGIYLFGQYGFPLSWE